MTQTKTTKKSAKKVSTNGAGSRSFEKVPVGKGFTPWLAEMRRRRGFVNWLAGFINLSRRDLAYLAQHGIPGLSRSTNGYNHDWKNADVLKLGKWIRNRKRFKKGNRKAPKTQKGMKKMAKLDQLVRAIRRVTMLSSQIQIRRLPEDQLSRLERALLPALRLVNIIHQVRGTAY
jgi:hypothetical protein